MPILVVEDEFLSVAKEVFAEPPPGEQFHFAATYEEALALFNTVPIDGVITDLFFPSEMNWVTYYLLQTADPDKCCRRSVRGAEGEGRWNFLGLDENPSGLAIWEECIHRELPIVIVSQDGNRHFGKFGAVRYACDDIPIFSSQKRGITGITLYAAGAYGRTDKAVPKIWQDCILKLLGSNPHGLK